MSPSLHRPGARLAAELLVEHGIDYHDAANVLLQLADLLHPPASHMIMRGWEAFGVAPQEASSLPPHRVYGDDWPIVRRIGTNAVDPELTAKQEAELEDWPDPELHAGVAGWHLHGHADDINGGYLVVWGPDRDAVRQCWLRLAALIPLDVWA